MVREVNENDWCILRMRGSSTMPLAESLKLAGFDVWTPIEVQQRRVGHQRQRKETRVPALATFIFARWKHLTDLLIIAASQLSSHRDFSVMQRDGGFVRVPDASLDKLREYETSSHFDARKRTAPEFAPGDAVRVQGDGAFEGLRGVVLKPVGKKWVMVGFPGWAIPVEIAPWNIELVPQPGVEGKQSITDIAA